MAQAPGIATCMPSDNIQAKGRTDIPMGEFWMSQEDGTIDCKEAAAAAHVYGRRIVAAESFTGSMADVSPARMKPLADAALAQGVNRFVVLAYVHQPWDDKKPGVTEDRFYLPYQRHNTWWDYSTGFWNTLSRSSQMMQTGSPVIDILYHLGNDAPLKIATWRMRPIPPNGYDYDVCGDEVLLQASVKNGRIVLPGGMNYSVLVLAGGNHMTLAATKHLQLLVKNGATIIGPDKPLGSPSLADGASGDREIRSIADALWGKKESKISQDTSLEKLLSGLQVMKDFEAISSKKAAAILYAHRSSGKDEIYFLANHSNEPMAFTGVFRVHGLFPQAWDPEKGTIRAFANFDDDHVRTKVPMTLEANSSIFVVFREGRVAAEADSKLIRDLDAWKTLDGSWNVYFPPINSTKEEKLKIFNELISWTDDKDSFIKNYSGTVIYTREVMVDEIPEGGLVLDLGKVQVIASLKINGRDCGNLWKAPYAIDVSPFIHKGKNQLEIKVTNLWVNRLIADAGLPKEEKITWATFNPYKPGDQLLPSGLLGPVILRVKKNK
jgi:hypothetical protein